MTTPHDETPDEVAHGKIKPTYAELELDRNRLRAQLAGVVERCAVTAWNTGMDLHTRTGLTVHDCREVGSMCAAAIRALSPVAAPQDAQADAERYRTKINNQRRELRRLNKYLGPYWAGFRKGLDMEAECRLRGIMNAAFGHEKVHAAEHAAIDAARAGKQERK